MSHEEIKRIQKGIKNMEERLERDIDALRSALARLSLNVQISLSQHGKDNAKDFKNELVR